MTNFNFEHFFEEKPELKQEEIKPTVQFTRPSLTFLQKRQLKPDPKILDEVTDKIQINFKPTIKDKKQIIEEFLMWAHEKNLSADNSGTLLMYIRELKGR